jgi:hypothetical protein
MLVLPEIMGRKILNGKKGVFKNPSLSGQNAKPDGTVIGDFP